MIQPVTIQINANLHPAQAEIHRHPARFKVVDAGRRFGKTRLGVNECLGVASQGGRAWWVAPSYKMSEVGWRPLRQIGNKLGAEVRLVDRSITLPNGGEVVVRSADNPNSLRGEGLDFVVLDECGYMQGDAWSSVLRPALSDRQGKALFISTPKGRNWFWRLWTKGRDAGDEWQSWRFPTSANPYVPASEIEAARQELPERIFQQEYLAEFIDDAGGVFRGVMDAATAIEQSQAVPGHGYIYGIDWGKYQDFTVMTVLDAEMHSMAYMDRFNQIDYAIQMDRLKALCERFPPRSIIAERNSMGDPLVEQLTRAGLPVQPFTTNNASKQQAIDALALAFERQEITILPDPVLIDELQAYEMERLPSGMLRYSAPAGMHDDTVIALALAWQGLANQGWLFL